MLLLLFLVYFCIIYWLNLHWTDCKIHCFVYFPPSLCAVSPYLDPCPPLCQEVLSGFDGLLHPDSADALV